MMAKLPRGLLGASFVLVLISLSLIAGTPIAASQPVAEVRIALDFGRPIPLTLGADVQADDGFAREDELQLPAWKPNFSAWSQRGRRHLTTDMLRFAPQSVLRWELIVTDSTRANDLSQHPGTMRVLEGTLPTGYQAWAVSHTRGMKFRLEEGANLPMAGGINDTLSILVGPLAKLAALQELSKASLTVEDLALRLETDATGRQILTLALPWNCEVEISLWSISGSKLTSVHPGELGQGIYRFPLVAGKNSQVRLLSLKLHGNNVNRQITQKVMW